MLDSSKTLGSVERWRMHSDKWEFMCEMPQPLCFVGLVADKGRILVLGGNHTNELASKVYAYNGKAMFSLAGALERPDSFPHSAPHLLSTSSGERFLIGKNYVHKLKENNALNIYMQLPACSSSMNLPSIADSQAY